MRSFITEWRRWLALGLLGCAAAPLEARVAGRFAAQMPARLLASHNATRAAAGVAPLAWDRTLEAEAANYAMSLAIRNQFGHSRQSSRRGTGENLWMGTRNAFSVEAMFHGWESEKRLFRPGNFPAVSRGRSWQEVGHYTQIIWPSTQRVGCALASNRTFDFLVCRYWPAGNVHGEAVPHRSRQTAFARR